MSNDDRSDVPAQSGGQVDVQQDATDATIQLTLDKLVAEITEVRRELNALRSGVGAFSNSLQEIPALVGPFGASMPDGTMLVQTIHKTKYLIDPLDLIIAPNLIVYRQWEADLSALFIQSAHKDMVFVDVGANFGYFTCLLGSRIGNSGHGKIWAIEPNPNCVKLLQRNVSINWAMCPISILPIGVGAASATMQLAVPKDRASNGSILSTGHGRLPDDTAVYAVEIQRLDDVLPETQIVDCIKIDVEGHEWSVLSGARKTIERSLGIKIIMEWAPDQMKTAGYSADQMCDLLEELGLSVFSPQKGCTLTTLVGKGLDRDHLRNWGYDNLILSRKAH